MLMHDRRTPRPARDTVLADASRPRAGDAIAAGRHDFAAIRISRPPRDAEPPIQCKTIIRKGQRVEVGDDYVLQGDEREPSALEALPAHVTSRIQSHLLAQDVAHMKTSKALQPVTHVPPFERLKMTPGILSYLGVRDVVHASQVSTRLKQAANATQLEGTSVTLNDIHQSTRGHEVVGLHGASSVDAASLFGGVDHRPVSQSNFSKGLQLGAGFYRTVGRDDDAVYAAKFFAGERRRQLNDVARNAGTSSAKTAESVGESNVFRVATRNEQMLSKTSVPGDAPWPNPKQDPPKYMRPDTKGADIVTSPIDMAPRARGLAPPRQAKYNPHVFAKDLPAAMKDVFPRNTGVMTPDTKKMVEEKRKNFSLQVWPPVDASDAVLSEFVRSRAKKNTATGSSDQPTNMSDSAQEAYDRAQQKK